MIVLGVWLGIIPIVLLGLVLPFVAEQIQDVYLTAMVDWRLGTWLSFALCVVAWALAAWFWSSLLVQLDRQPYQILVEQKRLDWRQSRLSIDRMVRMLEAARADLEQARDQVRSSVAALEEAWRAVEGQQEQVRYRVASLRAEAAALRAGHAELILAQKDHERIKNLVAQQSGTPAELEAIIAQLDTPAKLFVVEGGDHSFNIPKHAPLAQADVFRAAQDQIEIWLRTIVHR